MRHQKQAEALKNLVTRAKQEVPMYQSLYEGLELPSLESISDLQQLPSVSKALIKQCFPDRSISTSCNVKDLYQISTSGTSDRVMLFHDEHKRNWDRAADLILKMRTGALGKVLLIPPDECYERCGFEEKRVAPLSVLVRDAFKNIDQSSKQKARRKLLNRVAQKLFWRESVMPAPGVDGSAVDDQVIKGYFSEIQTLKPSTIRALPFYLLLLARRGQGQKIGNHVKVRPLGGKASSAMIKAIENELGVDYAENYGTSELGTISLEGQTPGTQTLFEHLFIIEFVRNGKPVPVGEYGEMLVTDLRNHASPLIRYAVGDVGRITYLPKDNDRRQLEFEVAGRLDECIINEAGKVTTPDDLMDFLVTCKGADFARLIQRSQDQFLLEVVPNESELDPEHIERSLSELLEQDIRLQIRKVRRIAPEASGKYKLIQSGSYQNFHQKLVHQEPVHQDVGG